MHIMDVMKVDVTHIVDAEHQDVFQVVIAYHFLVTTLALSRVSVALPEAVTYYGRHVCGKICDEALPAVGGSMKQNCE